MNRRAFCLLGLPCLALPLALGCGKAKPNGPVVVWEGTVTVGGQPLPSDLKEAYIQVRPANPDRTNVASPTQGAIVDGKYRLENVPRGDVTVIFILTQPTGKEVLDRGSGSTFAETVSLVPKKKKQGIPATATEDNLKMDFDL